MPGKAISTPTASPWRRHRQVAGFIAFMAALFTLPEPVQAQEDLILFNGGIGLEEREQAPSRGTRLEFFAQGGNFLANIDVQVNDADGRELLSTRSQGPWLILDLPAGDYTLTARDQAGNSQGVAFTVGERPGRVGIMFPER